MAEFSKNFEQVNLTKRVIRSRKNTPEERRRQRPEWRKAKQERKMAKLTSSIPMPATMTSQQQDDLLVPDIIEEHHPCSSNQGDNKKPRFEGHTAARGEWKMNGVACSRSAKMVHMALTKEQLVSHKQKPHQKFIEKQVIVRSDSKFEPKELKPQHLEYLSENPVGCGSFGKCFHGRYRGIEVIVKQMTHDNAIEDQERARKDLLHEAKVISALGDHPNLQMLFGVVTESLPLCLVTQFHGVKEESTLHHAADANMLTSAGCISVFEKICSALGHVHLKGYLHT